MATDYVHLHKKALSSWVFNDPRRWHFFSYLMMKADEKGYAEVSLREYSKVYGVENTWVRRCLKEFEEMEICDAIVHQKRHIVFICNYARYNDSGEESAAIMPQKCHNNDDSDPSQKDKKEKVFPPDPLYKEKEKKECEEEEKKEPLTRGKKELDLVEPAAENIPTWRIHYHRPRGITGTADERRAAFWQRLVENAAHYPDWPPEVIRRFFMDWTQTTLDGKYYKFEVLRPAIPKEMTGYLSIHQAQQQLQQARLAAIGNAVKRQQSRQTSDPYVKAMAKEVKAVYDRYFEGEEQ